MYFHFSNVSLYKNLKANGRRYYFNFASFPEYKMHTHRRLLSLVRLERSNAEAAAAVERSGWRRKRGNRGGRSEREANIATYKRPLSIVVQPSDQSPVPKRHCGDEWTTLSRATNDAILCDPDEESAVFPQWQCPNPRRWSDSISSLSSVAQSVSTPETVQLFTTSNPCDAMESE